MTFDDFPNIPRTRTRSEADHYWQAIGEKNPSKYFTKMSEGPRIWV
jgi:hypothetical protein